MKKKTAIIVSSLINKGGVERVVMEQAKEFDADIYVGRYDAGTTFPEFQDLKIKKISMLNIKPGSILGNIFTLYLWWKFSRLKLKKYDVYIFHGTATINAAKNNKPNIYYCHSPSRYLYDLNEREKKKHKGIKKFFYIHITKFQRNLDQQNINHIDRILVNSKNVQKRVEKYYNRSSKVVYPFVNLNKWKKLQEEIEKEEREKQKALENKNDSINEFVEYVKKIAKEHKNKKR